MSAEVEQPTNRLADIKNLNPGDYLISRPMTEEDSFLLGVTVTDIWTVRLINIDTKKKELKQLKYL